MVRTTWTWLFKTNKKDTRLGRGREWMDLEGLSSRRGGEMIKIHSMHVGNSQIDKNIILKMSK